ATGANGNFSIGGATTLTNDATVTAGAGNVTFSGAVDGAKALVVNSSGATIFSNAVGGGTALLSLTTDAGGSVSLASVTTAGNQSYGDATANLSGTYNSNSGGAGGNFSIGGASTLTGNVIVTAGGGNVTFTGAVDGSQSLTVNSSNATTFSNAVGGITALTSLTTNAGGAVSLANVSTNSTQSYDDKA